MLDITKLEATLDKADRRVDRFDVAIHTLRSRRDALRDQNEHTRELLGDYLYAARALQQIVNDI